MNLRSLLYLSARVLGDWQAIRRGPKAVAKRLRNRVVGRVVGKTMRKILR